jgi:hypothetical protein
MWCRSTSAVVVTLASLVAQADPPPARPAEPPPGLQDLARAVDAAHRGARNAAAEKREIGGYRGSLTLTPLDRQQDNVEVRLTAAFLAPTLLRYEVEEAGKKLGRGNDAQGAWESVGDQVTALRGRENTQTRDLVEQHVRLADQLLRFLDPASSMRRLERPSEVVRTDLTVGRTKVSANKVSGSLPDFPLYRAGGGGHAVQLELWFDATTNLLAAARATPYEAAGPSRTPAELVMLSEYRELDGVQVPTRLWIYREDPDASVPTPLVRVEITSLDLDPPDLDARALARPKPPPPRQGR